MPMTGTSFRLKLQGARNSAGAIAVTVFFQASSSVPNAEVFMVRRFGTPQMPIVGRYGAAMQNSRAKRNAALLRLMQIP